VTLFVVSQPDNYHTMIWLAWNVIC